MTDQFAYNLKRLLELFQATWAERHAFRVSQGVEASGHRADWDGIFQAAETSARELFQLALLDLDNEVPPALVLEKLLERLEASQK
jgi:hypothetical protein